MTTATKVSVSGNMLKWLAALFMVIDHVGMIFFPGIMLFRAIGRLAFPIFAFMIAEGCRYTKNKLRYFLMVFALGVGCQIVYYLFDRSLYMCVLVTFSLGILMTYALQYAKDCCFSKSAPLGEKMVSVLLLAVSVTFTYLINTILTVDYGFWGCLLPVFASLPQMPKKNAPAWWSGLDQIPHRVLSMGVGLVLLAVYYGGIQVYSLAALPLLLLYSGARGKRKMKYFFYVFYPAHLALLEGIYMLLH